MSHGMPMAENGPLILDTHVWLWTMAGSRDHLSAYAIEEIEAHASRGRLYVAAISVWEVAMLESRGRVRLARRIDDWVEAALSAPGTHFLPLSPAIAIESTRLPGHVHGDPADRMLIASARITGGRLATLDQRIIDYASDGHLEVLDAGRGAPV